MGAPRRTRLLLLLLVAAGVGAGTWQVKKRLATDDADVAEGKSNKRKVPTVDTKVFPNTEPPPAFTKDRMLTSQLVTQAQFDTHLYKQWAAELKEVPRYHRKQWEFVFAAQALAERGMLAPGKKGLGFGVGQEPLPALFAKRGAEILATDLAFAEAAKLGWVESNQHMSSKEVLNKHGILTPEELERLIKVQNVDMTRIPPELTGFDFTWSSCALGHLGNLERGLVFIENSLATLKPGGVAVHTTEVNLSSDTETMETVGTSVYRKRDILALIEKLTAQGHEVTINFNHGSGELDKHLDLSPYTPDKHLKIELGGYVITSLGLIIRKNPAATP